MTRRSKAPRTGVLENGDAEILEVNRGSAGQAVPKQDLGPEANSKPLKFVSNAGRDMGNHRYSKRSSPLRSGCIGDGRVRTGWYRRGRCYSIVDPIADEAVREHENRFLRETVANRAQTTQLEKTGTTWL